MGGRELRVFLTESENRLTTKHDGRWHDGAVRRGEWVGLVIVFVWRDERRGRCEKMSLKFAKSGE